MKRKKRPAKKARAQQIRVTLSRVEIKAGHDGLLRGKPEPVILLAAYLVDLEARSEPLRFLGEAMARLHPSKPFPTQVVLDEEVKIAVELRQLSDGPHRLLVLALALEEDSSADVQRLYKRLATPDSLFLWDGAALIPTPVTLANAARWNREATGIYAVHVMDGVADVAEQCEGDAFIAAQAVIAELSTGPLDCRLRFVAADRRNDWLAQLEVRC